MHIKTSDTPCADVLHHIINTHYIQIMVRNIDKAEVLKDIST
jgi:hypothetical protein